MPNCGSKMWQHRQMLSGENIQNLRILTEPELLKKKKNRKKRICSFHLFKINKTRSNYIFSSNSTMKIQACKIHEWCSECHKLLRQTYFSAFKKIQKCPNKEIKINFYSNLKYKISFKNISKFLASANAVFFHINILVI